MAEIITDKVRNELGGRDPSFWLMVAGLALGALVATMLVRAIFVGPIDSLAVRQACASYGFDQDHPVEKVEQESKRRIFNRVDATCTYGPSEDEEREGFKRTLAEVEPGGFFTTAKFLGLFLQVGSLAIYGRMVAEPLYRKFVLDQEETG